MPELVLESLTWIQDEEWLEIDRLDKQQLFETIIAPYVRNRLLAPESLLPAKKASPRSRRSSWLRCEKALRALVPYRLITRSHVIHHVEDNDPTFRDALKDADWQAEELWQAIAWTWHCCGPAR